MSSNHNNKKTMAQLRKEYVGGSEAFRTKLLTLREKLIGKYITEGSYSHEEATSYVNEHFISSRTTPTGRLVLGASPQAVEMLELTPRTHQYTEKFNVPELKEGWKTGNMLSKEYVGGSIKMNNMLQNLQQKLINQHIEKGLSEENAQTFVEENLLGIRRSGSVLAIAASPKSIEMLKGFETLKEVNKVKDLKKENAPKLEKGWKTASMIQKEYVGSDRTINAKILALQEKLITKHTDERHSEKEAQELVEKNFIGIRKPLRGPRALAASPKAIEMLKDLKKENAPKLEKDWKTASMIQKEYVADRNIIHAKLLTLQKNLIQEHTNERHNEEEAQKLVEKNFIGMRKPPSGQSALAASPEISKSLNLTPRQVTKEKTWVERIQAQKEEKTQDIKKRE